MLLTLWIYYVRIHKMCLEKTTTPDGRKASRYVQEVLHVIEHNERDLPTCVKTRLGDVALEVTSSMRLEQTIHYEGVAIFPEDNSSDSGHKIKLTPFSLTIYNDTHNDIVGELRRLQA